MALKQEAIFLRSEEYSQIWTLLEMFVNSNDSLSVLVVAWGGPGTGKTTVAKRLVANAESVWRRLKTIYLDTEAEGLQGIFTPLQRVMNLRGYAAIELLRFLERNGHRLFIVIDNAETVLQRDRSIQAILRIGEASRGSFFILMLFRSEENPIDIVNALPPVHLVYFKPYESDEIHQILKDNLKNYGYCSVSETVLKTISRAASSSGDAKLALMILDASLNAAGGGSVEEHHVLEAIKKLSESRMITQSNDPHTKMILRILLQHVQGINLRRLFEEYRRMAEVDQVKPLGYTQIWKRIRMLERKMLLDFDVVNLNSGRTGVVRVKCIVQPAIL